MSACATGCEWTCDCLRASSVGPVFTNEAVATESFQCITAVTMWCLIAGSVGSSFWSTLYQHLLVAVTRFEPWTPELRTSCSPSGRTLSAQSFKANSLPSVEPAPGPCPVHTLARAVPEASCFVAQDFLRFWLAWLRVRATCWTGYVWEAFGDFLERNVTTDVGDRLSVSVLNVSSKLCLWRNPYKAFTGSGPADRWTAATHLARGRSELRLLLHTSPDILWTC
jgi:hypothetical protein